MSNQYTPGNKPALVLIAEDESEIAEILSGYLQRYGLRTLHASDGQQALELQQRLKPDLVILDIQMPVLDGWQVLQQLRSRCNTPVIMLTALDQDLDKVMGLRLGADDYVVKPFNPAEVVARVQAVLRRTQAHRVGSPQTLRFGPFYVDFDSHQASVDIAGTTQKLDLTLTEFKLLSCLMRAPKRVFSREELLLNCLPEGDTQERTVDSHISKLRKKLEALGMYGIPVSIWGVGYRFGDDV
jgi:two-component system response regulator AdeR